MQLISSHTITKGLSPQDINVLANHQTTPGFLLHFLRISLATLIAATLGSAQAENIVLTSVQPNSEVVRVSTPFQTSDLDGNGEIEFYIDKNNSLQLIFSPGNFAEATLNLRFALFQAKEIIVVVNDKRQQFELDRELSIDLLSFQDTEPEIDPISMVELIATQPGDWLGLGSISFSSEPLIVSGDDTPSPNSADDALPTESVSEVSLLEPEVVAEYRLLNIVQEELQFDDFFAGPSQDGSYIIKWRYDKDLDPNTLISIKYKLGDQEGIVTNRLSLNAGVDNPNQSIGIYQWFPPRELEPSQTLTLIFEEVFLGCETSQGMIEDSETITIAISNGTQSLTCDEGTLLPYEAVCDRGYSADDTTFECLPQNIDYQTLEHGVSLSVYDNAAYARFSPKISDEYTLNVYSDGAFDINIYFGSSLVEVGTPIATFLNQDVDSEPMLLQLDAYTPYLIEILPAQSTSGQRNYEISIQADRGEVFFDSEPSGAKVFVDDVEIGTTPTAGHLLSAGSHKIKLILNNYDDLNYSLKVEVGQSLLYNSTLTKAKVETKLPVSITGNLSVDDRSGGPDDGRIFDVYTFKLSSRAKLLIDLFSKDFATSIFVSDANGNIKASAVANDSNSTITADVELPAGTYEIVATSASPNKQGAYRLNAKIAPQIVDDADTLSRLIFLGGTIQLASKTFELTNGFFLTKSLELIGAGKEKTKIVFTTSGIVVSEDADYFKVKGISFEHLGNVGGNVIEISGGSIEILESRITGGKPDADGNYGSGLAIFDVRAGIIGDCVIENNSGDGIVIGQGTQITISNNKISNNEGFGISFFDGSSIAEKNTIFGNGLSGILISDGATPKLRENIIRNNGESGLAYFNESGGNAEKNTIEGNSFSGAYISDQATPILSQNIIKDNNIHGIEYRGNSSGKSINNLLETNGANGVVVYDQAQPTLESNDIRLNTENGILISSDSASSFQFNTIEQNGYSGINVAQQANPTLLDNVLRRNEMYGIVYIGASGGEATRNIVEENKFYGIALTNEARVTLINNQIRRNIYGGISYDEGSGGDAQNNIIEKNEGDGIYVGGFAQPGLESNTINENSRSGIVYVDTATGVARGNNLTDGYFGIEVTGESHPDLINNTITNNSSGIQISGSSYPKLEGNSVEFNGSGITYNGEAYGVAQGNSVTRNDVNGFQIGERAHPNLENNIIENNKAAGILFYGNSWGNVSNNNIAFNSIGIQIVDGTNPSLSGNYINSNYSLDVCRTDINGTACR